MTVGERDPGITPPLQAEDVGVVFKCFGDPARLRVLVLLKGQENPLTFAEIRRRISGEEKLVPGSTVSSYLDDLHRAGLVDRQYSGASSLSELGNEVFDMISEISQPLLMSIMRQKLKELERLTRENIARASDPQSREEMEQMLRSIEESREQIITSEPSLPQ